MPNNIPADGLSTFVRDWMDSDPTMREFFGKPPLQITNAARQRLARALVDDLHECRDLHPYDNPAVRDSREAQPLASRVHLLRCQASAAMFGCRPAADISRYVMKEIPRVALSSCGMREAVLGTNDAESYRR